MKCPGGQYWPQSGSICNSGRYSAGVANCPVWGLNPGHPPAPTAGMRLSAAEAAELSAQLPGFPTNPIVIRPPGRPTLTSRLEHTARVAPELIMIYLLCRFYFFSICHSSLHAPCRQGLYPGSWHSMGTTEVVNTPSFARTAPWVPCTLTGALPGQPSCASPPPREGGTGASSLNRGGG